MVTAQADAKYQREPQLSLKFICWLDQALLLQALLTSNWICSKVFLNSTVLSHALVIFLVFNNPLNKGRRQEGTILLDSACTCPSCVVLIHNQLMVQPSHRHGLP